LETRFLANRIPKPCPASSVTNPLNEHVIDEFLKLNHTYIKQLIFYESSMQIALEQVWNKCQFQSSDLYPNTIECSDRTENQLHRPSTNYATFIPYQGSMKLVPNLHNSSYRFEYTEHSYSSVPDFFIQYEPQRYRTNRLTDNRASDDTSNSQSDTDSE